ncbi:MAG: FAD-dependent thymidylate synthase [Pseudomonadota bacterium]
MKQKFITKPKVYLVGTQQVNDEHLKEFLNDEEIAEFTTDTVIPGEILAESAGRICYMSFGKGRKSNREYLDNIISSHHGSVLEHVVWNFVITGISRSLTHELIRHRAGFAYSQLSQRYVDESDAQFVCPPLYVDHPELKKKWEDMMERAHRNYCELADSTAEYVKEKYPELKGTDRRKLVRQSARSVLPNSTETKLFVSANARSWRHFLEMRGSRHADTEIRELALAIFRVLKPQAPNIFADMDIVKDEGVEEIRVTHSKV